MPGISPGRSARFSWVASGMVRLVRPANPAAVRAAVGGIPVPSGLGAPDPPSSGPPSGPPLGSSGPLSCLFSPPAGGENRQDSGPDDPSGGPDGGPDDGGSGAPSPDGTGIPPTAARTAAGFAGRTNLTIPLATQLNLADRPGEIPGIGPVETTPGARCTSSEVTVPLPHPAAEARADDLLRGREGVRSRALPYAWRSQPALLKTAAEAAD